MEFVVRKSDVMCEVNENAWFDFLQSMNQTLVYVVDELAIDIVPESSRLEYDFWDMIANVSFSDKEEEEQQREMCLKRLEEIGVQEG